MHHNNITILEEKSSTIQVTFHWEGFDFGNP